MSYKFRNLNHFGCFRNILHKCNFSMVFNGSTEFSMNMFQPWILLLWHSSRHYIFSLQWSCKLIKIFHKSLVYDIFIRNSLSITQITQLIWNLSLSWLIRPLNGTALSSLTSSMLLPKEFLLSLHGFLFDPRFDF